MTLEWISTYSDHIYVYFYLLELKILLPLGLVHFYIFSTLFSYCELRLFKN